ncbi:MAG TPA: LytTR family DNA-binding domain-containing protein [Puia sp.]|nr:LytTR family DNA-binding domain-containing protein [Puia sp.]
MIRCLAVDDESLSLDLLEDNIKRVPFLHLAGRCQNVYEAMDAMRGQSIDLLFLDIQMPGLSGLQFIQSLPVKPLVIFVTAFKKYALEGFELDALDYLVKPVMPQRFLKAVNKAAQYYSAMQTPVPPQTELAPAPPPPAGTDYFFVNVEYNLVKILTDDIAYIEGLRDYIKIHLVNADKPIISKLSMKTLFERLSPARFIRVHKSYIIAIDKIRLIRKNRIYIKNELIPISDFYRDNLLSLISPRYLK